MYLTPTVICQSHQAFGSLRSSYADWALNYKCNYYNLETLNDELHTKTEQDLFLFHVNIRSVIKNEDDLTENISAMRFLSEIIAITEIKLQANRIFHSKLQGYICIWADSLTCAGGMAFLIKSILNYQIRDDLNIFVPGCENRWIEINHPDKNGIVIGVVYRHPQHDHSEFQEAFQENILQLNKSKKVFYPCGDYNINLLQSDANNKIASYLNSVTSSGCGSFCLIDKPTRLGESSTTLLDHFYTNNLTTPITSGILESDISDHLPTFVLSRSYIPPCSSASYKFRRHF